MPYSDPESTGDRAGKSSRVPRIGGRKTEARPAPVRPPSAAKKRPRAPARGGGPVSTRIPPKPSPYTELTRERAEKLATLRRGRFDEFTWAALTGLLATIPSTAHSLSVVFSRNKFFLELSEAVDLGMMLIFVVLVAVAFMSGKNRGPTSMQYLERHFGKDPDAEPPRRHWWSWNKEI